MTPFLRSSKALTLWLLATTVSIFISMSILPSTTDAQATTPSSLAKMLTDRTDLTNFRELLASVGVSPSEAQTLFAPSEDAFRFFQEQDPRLYRVYLGDAYIIHRRILLQWHLVTEDVFTADMIFDGSRTAISSNVGTIVINQIQQTIGDNPRASLVETDVQATDGIMHVTDRIIFPPILQTSLIDAMFFPQNDKFLFNIMANLALFSGLDEEINKIYEGGITILLPPNRRFNRAEINVPLMLTPGMKDYTRDFVLCHMIPEIHFLDTVRAKHAAGRTEQHFTKTFLGTHIWITTSASKFRFQSQEVLLEDQIAQGGVYHGIDVPLTPPMASDFAAIMHVSTTWDTELCNRMFVSARWTSSDMAAMANSTVSVFCPTREAFGFFNEEAYNRLIEPEWRRHLRDFLSHHVAVPALTREQYFQQAPSTITMLSGSTHLLRKRNGNPRIGTAEMVFGDLIATDGYFHMIDEVLTPPSVQKTIYNLVKESNSSYNGLSLFAINVDFVQLTDLVDRDLPLTIFVPFNRAWRRIEYKAEEAKRIVRKHVVRGLLYADVIANKTQIFNVDSGPLDIERKIDSRTNATSLWVGGAKIIQEDIFTVNGLMHVIDRVLDEPFETNPPTTSPAPTITAEPTRYKPPTAMPVFQPTNPPVVITFRPVEQVTPSAAADKPTWERSGSQSISCSVRFALTTILLGVWAMFG